MSKPSTHNSKKNAIREKIDAMVKRAIVKTLFSEQSTSPFGPSSKDSRNVYASEDYTSVWDVLPEGEPSDAPSVSATQEDFKRWFIRNYLESNTSPLRLEPDERDQLLAQFDAMDPNQMVEWINANPNELFSFSPYENDSMALVKILAAYTNSKGVRQRMTAQAGLIDQMSNATADGEAPEEREPEPAGRKRSGKGDVEDTLQATQDVLATDPTERLNSRQAVDNRIKTALGKLHRSAEAKAIMQFLFDKNKNEAHQGAVMEMIDQLTDRIMEVTADYTDLFVDSMFEAFDKVGFPEDDANDSETSFNQQNAFNQAISDIAPNATANDIALFRKALSADMGDGTTVHETILNKSANDPGVRDAVIRAVMEVFETNDMDMQFLGATDGDGNSASSATDVAYEDFVRKFVDAMFDAFTEEGPELQQAFAEGITDFSAKLQASGVKKPIGSQELGVFESILMSDVDGTRRIVDIFLQGDVEDAMAYDEAWEASFEKFKAEINKQTLFNSLGDYIDIQPDIIELRNDVFDTVRAASSDDLEALRNTMSAVKE